MSAQSDALKPLAKEWITQIPMGRLAEVTDLEVRVRNCPLGCCLLHGLCHILHASESLHAQRKHASSFPGQTQMSCFAVLALSHGCREVTHSLKNAQLFV